MKKLFYLFLLFIIISCSNTKKVYWCGDHPCINGKEKEAYFKKTMTVEIKELDKATDKNKSEVAKIMKQAKVEEKKRIKNEKYLAKQIKIEEKMRIKEEKKLAKQVVLDEKKIIKKERKPSKQTVSIASSSKNVTIYSNKFKELAERIIKKNAIRPYPDINVTPN
jgi:hypothetical protein